MFATPPSLMRRMQGMGTPAPIAEVCPASQTVLPILEKIVASEFLGGSHLEMRRKAYCLSQGPGMGFPIPEELGCDCCKQDRIVFRDVIHLLLTEELSALLDICDRLEPWITTALEEASTDMMEAWARSGHGQRPEASPEGTHQGLLQYKGSRWSGHHDCWSPSLGT